jgi:DNA polymerase III subunit epsilon
MGKIIKGPWSLISDSNSNRTLVNDKLEYVSFDVETTGLYKNDRIVEIGFTAFSNGKVIEEWSTLINPLRDIGKSNIHGITPSMVSAAPLFEDVINDIFRMINGRVLVAHNLGFDARMLIQEFNRAQTQGEIGKGFCTMVASRRVLAGSGDSLAATCSELGIETVKAHSALGDARMTMQIFQKLMEDEQEVSPAFVEYKKGQNPTRVLVREAFSSEPDDALDRIKAFTQKIPFPTSDEKFVAYLLLLNMAMQDLVISKNEQSELDHWAIDLGVTSEERNNLHQGYLDSFIQAALRDGVITIQEREMIEMVGKALKLPVLIPDVPQAIQANEDNLSVGKRVCFTGEAAGFSGNAIHRADLEALAAKVGLHPVGDVTKKGCDLLVAADTSSMSGKAKKAKEYGIPVISVEKFITYCTFGK